MLSRRTFLSTLAAGLCNLSASSAFAGRRERVVLRAAYQEDAPPYSFLDPNTNTMQGILVDLMNTLAEAGNFDIEHTGYPWARAQKMLAAGREDVFFCPATDDRWGYALFAPTPVTTLAPAEIFFAADNPNVDKIRAARRKEDLYRLSTVDYIGNSAADAIWQHHPQRTLVSEIDTILAMLLNGHADFYLADPFVTRFKMQKLGLLPKFSSVSGTCVTSQQKDRMQFGLRRSFPNAEAVISQIDRAIRGCIGDEFHTRIVARYTI